MARMNAGIEIVEAADVIEKTGCAAAIGVARSNCARRGGIEQQAVDGEVAALHVFARGFGVADLVGVAAIGVDAVSAEGCDLGDAALGHRALFAAQRRSRTRPGQRRNARRRQRCAGTCRAPRREWRMWPRRSRRARGRAAGRERIRRRARLRSPRERRVSTMWRAASNWGVLGNICVYCHSQG